MNNYNPLFVASLPRSGSYLINMMLSANPDVEVACEPYLELFRSMRNAFIRVGASESLQQEFNSSAPFQDYYFSDELIELLDIIQAGDLSTSILEHEWKELLKNSKARTALQCGELVPYLEEIRGSDYKEIFDNAFKIIAKARNSYNCKWLGMKEAWAVEFFGPLARAYPEAKFVIIFRDPRAIINSHLGMNNKSKIANILSYVRHWRKMLAFKIRYQNDDLFSNRLYVLTHEQVVTNPEKKARDLCDFLEVEYSSDMIDTNKFFDHATGSIWKGNSSFEKVTTGISKHRAERWREMLDPKVLKMIEFTCGFDMELMGYEPTTKIMGQWPNSDILEYLIQSCNNHAKWRSDFEDPQKDYGFELFRHALVTQSEGDQESAIIRRSFLFEDVFKQLRGLTKDLT